MTRTTKALDTVKMPWGETFHNVQIVIARYGNGDLAVQMYDPMEGPLATPTVNLEHYGLHPVEGAVFIRADAEGEGMLELLEQHGIVERTGRIESFGPFAAWAQEARLQIDYPDA